MEYKVKARETGTDYTKLIEAINKGFKILEEHEACRILTGIDSEHPFIVTLGESAYNRVLKIYKDAAEQNDPYIKIIKIDKQNKYILIYEFGRYVKIYNYEKLLKKDECYVLGFK